MDAGLVIAAKSTLNSGSESPRCAKSQIRLMRVPDPGGAAERRQVFPVLAKFNVLGIQFRNSQFLFAFGFCGTRFAPCY